MFENKSLIDQRYQVIKLLGQGAFASVYSVEDVLTLRQQYALKVFNSLSKKPEVWESIRNALHFAHQINHPNLLNVYDFGILYPDGLPYLLSEYVAGETMARFQGVPSPQVFRMVATQLVSALHALHSVGLLHLDIKPSNIMLSSPQSGPVHPKLIDIGSFLVKQNLSLRCFPTTYDFLEPTVIRGGKATESTDLFALGVTLFSWLSGNHPFGNLSQEEHVGSIRLGRNLTEEINFEVCGEFSPFLSGLIKGDFQLASQALRFIEPPSAAFREVPTVNREGRNRSRQREDFKNAIDTLFQKDIRKSLLSNQMEKHFLMVSGSPDQEKSALICDVFLNLSLQHDLVFKRFQSIPQNSLFSFINRFTLDFSDLGALGGLSRTEILQSLVDPGLKHSFFGFIYDRMFFALRKLGPAIFVFENLSKWDFVFLDFMVGLSDFLKTHHLPVLIVLVFDHGGALAKFRLEFENPFLDRLVRRESFGEFCFPSSKVLAALPRSNLHGQFFSLIQTLPNPFKLSVVEKIFLVAPECRDVFFDLLHDGALIRDEAWFYVRKIPLQPMAGVLIGEAVLEGLLKEDDIFIFPLVHFFPGLKSSSVLLRLLDEDLASERFHAFQALIDIALKDSQTLAQFGGRLLFFKGRIQSYRGEVSAAIQTFQQALQMEKDPDYIFLNVVELQNAFAKNGQREISLDLICRFHNFPFRVEQRIFLKGVELVARALSGGPEKLPIPDFEKLVQSMGNSVWRGRLNLRYAQALIWSKNYQAAQGVLNSVIEDFSTNGQKFRRARALRMKSKVLRAQGNFKEALVLVEESLKILLEGNLPREEIEALIDFVFLKNRLEISLGIDGDLARMAKILTFFPDQEAYRLVWLELMGKAREMTQVDEALYFYSHLEKMARRQKKPQHLYIALINCALIEKRRGNQEEHVRLLNSARRVFKKNESKMPRRLQGSALHFN